MKRRDFIFHFTSAAQCFEFCMRPTFTPAMTIMMKRIFLKGLNFPSGGGFMRQDVVAYYYTEFSLSFRITIIN